LVSSKYPSIQNELASTTEIDNRDSAYAHVDVVAELRQQVRHVAVDRGKKARAPKIHLRLVELGPGLRDARLGAQALRT
jgi:hypothetical protein